MSAVKTAAQLMLICQTTAVRPRYDFGTQLRKDYSKTVVQLRQDYSKTVVQFETTVQLSFNCDKTAVRPR